MLVVTLFIFGLNFSGVATEDDKILVAAQRRRNDFTELWDRLTAEDQAAKPHRKLLTEGSRSTRYKLYEDNRKEVDRIRKIKGRKYKVTYDNEFALMSAEEKQLYLGVSNLTELARSATAYKDQLPPPPDIKYKMRRPRKYTGGRSQRQAEPAIPEAKDLRDLGMVTKVKSQGECGSCWVFAAVTVLEGAYALETGNLKNFSDKQLLDCNEEYGCSGGYWPTVWTDVIDNHYVALQEDYPYEPSKDPGLCSRTTPNGIPDARVQGWEVILQEDAEELMIDNMLRYGGVAVCLMVNSTIHFYSSGVINDCHGGKDACNHLVSLVAYTPDSLTFKNSWGSSWGENGYFRMQRGCPGDMGYSYWASHIFMSGDIIRQGPTVFNETIIYKKKKYALDNGVNIGDLFVIKGTDIGSSTKKWFADFIIGNDISFHIEFQRSQDVYKANSRIDYFWKQKTTGSFPKSIEEDGDFTLTINVTAEGFSSTVNGEVLQFYENKMSDATTSVNYIRVGGKGASFTSIEQLRLSQGSTSSSTLCMNKEKNCRYWSKQGYCKSENYEEFMSATCPLACGLCETFVAVNPF